MTQTSATVSQQVTHAVPAGVQGTPQQLHPSLTGVSTGGATAQPPSPCWQPMPPQMLFVQQPGALSSPGSRPPSQPPPTTRTPAQPPAAIRAMSQPPPFSHSPRVDMHGQLSQSSSGERQIFSMTHLQSAVSTLSSARPLGGASGSTETGGQCVVRRTFERERSDGREESHEAHRGGPFVRYSDLSAELAALRQMVEAQKAQLSTLAEQVQRVGSGTGAGADKNFGPYLEALRSEVADLHKQQDLQAGALRDGLMEIHQQRTELEACQASLSQGVVAAAANEDAERGLAMEELAAHIGAESEERRTSVAELHARLEREITEVLRKAGRRHEDLCTALEAEHEERTVAIEDERQARNLQLTELASALAAGGVNFGREAESPARFSQGGGLGSDTLAVHMNLVSKLSEALEAERLARASEGAELRAMLAQLSATVHRHHDQVGCSENVGYWGGDGSASNNAGSPAQLQGTLSAYDSLTREEQAPEMDVAELAGAFDQVAGEESMKYNFISDQGFLQEQRSCGNQGVDLVEQLVSPTY